MRAAAAGRRANIRASFKFIGVLEAASVEEAAKRACRDAPACCRSMPGWLRSELSTGSATWSSGPLIWLIGISIMISRGLIKTGLGARPQQQQQGRVPAGIGGIGGQVGHQQQVEQGQHAQEGPQQRTDPGPDLRLGESQHASTAFSAVAAERLSPPPRESPAACAAGIPPAC